MFFFNKSVYACIASKLFIKKYQYHENDFAGVKKHVNKINV